MRLNRFWHRVEAQAQRPDGRTWSLRGWVGSAVSAAEAEQLAAERARRWCELVTRGERLDSYDYRANGLREPLVAEHQAEDGRLLAAITINRYGAQVLNVTRVLIADIDVPPPGIFDWLKALFGRPRRDRAALRAEVEKYVDRRPGRSLALYETAAGLRALVLDRLYEPGSLEARRELEALGSDPLYIRLCRQQQCFRARLTPKPWRIGCRRPTDSFPYADAEAERDAAAWQQDYTGRAAAFSVCRFLGRFGGDHVLPEAETVLRLHDAAVLGEGPLA